MNAQSQHTLDMGRTGVFELDLVLMIYILQYLLISLHLILFA